MTVSQRNCYFLQRALESVRVQFWANLELIICCDHVGLVDECNEFLFDNHLRGEVVIVPPTTTRSDKFLECVILAKGEWLVVLDCDDMLPTSALSKLDICLKCCPGHSYFTTSQAQIDTKNALIHTLWCKPEDNTFNGIRHNFRQKHLWGFKGDDRAGLSQALKSSYIVEDYNFFATMAIRGKVPLCIPAILCCYRRHSLQVTQLESKKIAEMCENIQRQMDTALKNGDPLLQMKTEALAHIRREEMKAMEEAVYLVYPPF